MSHTGWPQQIIFIYLDTIIIIIVTIIVLKRSHQFERERKGVKGPRGKIRMIGSDLI